MPANERWEFTWISILMMMIAMDMIIGVSRTIGLEEWAKRIFIAESELGIWSPRPRSCRNRNYRRQLYFLKSLLTSLLVLHRPYNRSTAYRQAPINLWPPFVWSFEFDSIECRIKNECNKKKIKKVLFYEYFGANNGATLLPFSLPTIYMRVIAMVGIIF